MDKDGKKLYILFQLNDKERIKEKRKDEKEQ